MKRKRKSLNKRDDFDNDDALESLGMGKDRWTWDDDDEDQREKREQRAVDALHWEL